MSWITLTEAKVLTKFSAPELAVIRTVALKAGQADPLNEAITRVVMEVRGYVAACAANVLGEGQTIPEELEEAALSRITPILATRLPVASLLTEDRRKASENALTLLRDVARCNFRIVPATTAATDQVAGGNAVQVITSTTPRAKRCDLDGL